MKRVIWWQLISHGSRLVVVWLLLVAEHVVGVPCLSLLCFYYWFGRRDLKGQSWIWFLFALSAALVYQVSWGGTMVSLLIWWLLSSWSRGSFWFGKWWPWLTTMILSLIYVVTHHPSSWWAVGGSYLVGWVGWWLLTKRRKYENFA